MSLVQLGGHGAGTAGDPPAGAAAALAAELREAVRGEVRFDAGSRALYATDASNYRQVPIGVVLPRDAGDVVAAVAACRRHGAAVLPRGGGTSLAGQCCNVAVVMDFSKHMRRIVELDAARGLARVEPGVVLDDLRDAAERHHLTFAPDPATHSRCTLGGMIGNNSCGVHSVMAGKTVDNVLALDVLTYDGHRLRVGPTAEDELADIVRAGGRRGEIYAGLRALRDRFAEQIRRRFPKIPRRVSGYNLDQLLPENGFDVARALVGTEGTCVTVLEATVRLVASPPARTLLLLGYPDVYAAADHVMDVLAHRPIGLEGMDDLLVEAMRKKRLLLPNLELLPPGGGWLLVEFGGDTVEESDARARGLMHDLASRPGPPAMRLYEDRALAQRVWKVRESALAATALVPGEKATWEGWEDSAVPPDKVGTYLRRLRRLYERYGYRGALYGHFGDGCIHTRIDFDLVTEAGIRAFRAFIGEAADLVVSLGGSLSGEHGDGQSRAELLPKMFGAELVSAFGEFKALWDPELKMNPHKVVDPYRADENLRLGASYSPLHPATHFRYPDDGGSLPQATLRCVGVGECRRRHGGTMCPSFRVTGEEMHSTRGRARLLFEMLAGDPLTGGWREEAVKEALDLCLACKGCKHDCPAYVDMATYKAEFLSHYYARRARPRHAYAFGLIYWWSRLAALLPAAVNFATRTRALAGLAKAAAGMASERAVPAFAAQPFTRWFRRRETTRSAALRRAAPEAPRVLLWPDTFNNYFRPETARAAVEVLESLGYRVTLPPRPLCCGRPLYDSGMLHLAKRQLRQVLAVLRDDIRAGVPLVGLEPSCIAVFRDELGNLFPDDEDARRLGRQSLLLSELLVGELPAAGMAGAPRLSGKALVHGHCHHKAVLGFDAEAQALAALGLDCEVLDSGCCGMAGSFGFVAGEPYRVSVACGELVLLPAVRAAAADTLIVADGFSCREQIAQQTGRQTLHFAEVLHMALREGRCP
ncbi:MAG TPA: FAD-linked oxidase C-terminal domain-containing protein [Thermoanaerobaculia bacterium]|nr:FAD-linked oxidase C-terminal domain-containing protein [Thermoanaerobaculia bacterium]